MTSITGSRQDAGISAWKAGAAGAGLAAIASVAPSMHPRLGKQQLIITGIAAAAGLGVGVGVDKLSDVVDQHTSLNGLQSQLAVAGVAGAGAVGASLALHASNNIALHATRTGLGVIAGAALLGAGMLGEQKLVDQVAPNVPGGKLTAHATVLGGAALGAAGLILGRTRSSAVSVEAAEAYAKSMTAGLPDTTVAFDAAAFDKLEGLRKGMTTISGGPESLLPTKGFHHSMMMFLRDVTPKQEIERTMGMAAGTAMDPIRIASSSRTTASAEERAEAMLQEAIRLKAFDRAHVVLFAPTGSGYIYPQTASAIEKFSGGNSALVAMQWNDKPSAMSYGKVKDATALFDATIQKFADHIQTLPEGQRPKLALSGESLGAKAMHDVFAGKGEDEVARRGVDAMFSVGNSRNGPFRVENLGIEGQRLSDGGAMFEFDHPNDLAKLPAEQKAKIRTFLLSHHNDPAGKSTFQLLVEKPGWLSEERYGTGVPRKMKWMPGITGLHSLADMQNGANLKQGDFTRVGHDYRADMAPLVNHVFGFDATPKQLATVQDSLVQLELARKFRGLEDAAV